MKSTSEATSTKVANYLIAAILMIAPFHGFLTVWGASLVGHYTLLRAWSAVLLLILAGCAVVWSLRSKATRQWLVRDRLVRMVVLFALLTVLWTVVPLLTGKVSLGAACLGIFQDLRFWLFFLLVSLVARRSNWLLQHWQQIVLGPALVVAAFAVLQLTVLPDDFLKHFGYSAATIESYETINNDDAYPRFASTLRGANPLGAYLVVITGLLAAFYARRWRGAYWEILAALTAGALLASFSRSAWIGAAVAVFVVIITRSMRAKKTKQLWLASLGMLFLTGLTFTAFHSNPHVQNALFHTSDNSKVEVSSNDQRSSALSTAALDVLDHPLGGGVGSAGPASVHNTHGETKLAENYILQIGQEMGWVGLILFVSLLVMVWRRLWQRKDDPLALACLATLLGLAVVNLLSHAWADDTLAYVFWGLTAIALSSAKEKQSHED
jgi:hypothetical protein